MPERPRDRDPLLRRERVLAQVLVDDVGVFEARFVALLRHGDEEDRTVRFRRGDRVAALPFERHEDVPAIERGEKRVGRHDRASESCAESTKNRSNLSNVFIDGACATRTPPSSTIRRTRSV